MRIPWLVLVPAAIWAGNLPLHAYPLQVLTTNVQPLSGTASGGNTFPGAVLPFGMVQWSPDTSPSEPGERRVSEFRIPRADGKVRWVMWEAEIQVDGDGNLAQRISDADFVFDPPPGAAKVEMRQEPPEGREARGPGPLTPLTSPKAK